MYLLFRYKGWRPIDYWNMGFGEKQVTHAFMMEEMENREKELERIKQMGK